MPQKCFFKPNRATKRIWTAKTVAQVYCRALETGTTEPEIEKELEKCEKRGSRRERAANEALAEAEAALEGSNAVFDADLDFLRRFNLVTLPLVVLARVLDLIPHPIARLVSIGAFALREVAGVRIGRIEAQKAANDVALRVIRREAANEASFRRVGNL